MRGLRMAAMLAMVPLSGCAGILSLDLRSDGTEVWGSGLERSEVRFVRGFDEIEVFGIGRVVIEVGLEDRVEVTADHNIVPILGSRVVGRRLILGPSHGLSLRPVHDIVYHVTVRDLRELTVSGAVLAEVFDVDAYRFRANVSGAGHVVIDGVVDRLELRLSGGATFDAPGLEAFDATIAASGAARATVRVRDRLEVSGSGAAEVRYRGRPELYLNISGAARVWHY